MIANAPLHMPIVDVDPAIREHAARRPGPVPGTDGRPVERVSLRTTLSRAPRRIRRLDALRAMSRPAPTALARGTGDQPARDVETGS